MNHIDIVARLADTCRRCSERELFDLQSELSAATDDQVVVQVCSDWADGKAHDPEVTVASLRDNCATADDGFVLELADEPEGFEIDADALRDGLREAVSTTLSAIVHEHTERELNRIRGRVVD